MKRIALLLLLAGGSTPLATSCSAPAPVPQAPTPSSAPSRGGASEGKPAAVSTEDIPPIPVEITRRLAQYHAARSAAFQDLGPDGSVLVATRFAETSQLHLVPFPGGRREQITFTEEPVFGGRFVPGTGDVLYTQ